MAEFKGTVQEVGSVQTLPAKTPGKRPFVKRTILVKEDGNGKFDNIVEFTATGDEAGTIGKWSPGDRVKVGYFLSGRAWKDRNGNVRHFVEARIASIEADGVNVESVPYPTDGDDDMPF